MSAADELVEVVAIKSGYLDGIVAIAFCEAAGHERGPGENACLPCIHHAAVAMESTRETRAKWTAAAVVARFGEPEIEDHNFWDDENQTYRRLVFPWRATGTPDGPTDNVASTLSQQPVEEGERG